MKEVKYKMKTDNIIEIAKTRTREEFLREGITCWGCPDRYGLYYENSICDSDTLGCRDCWKCAVENIKFKDAEEPKLKPMTFEEAVKTGNKIKFKYSDNYNMAKGFLPFNDAIYFLTTPYFDNNVIRKLILEGTWFAEGVYE